MKTEELIVVLSTNIEPVDTQKVFYNAVRYGMDYVDPGASSYETRYRTRVIKNLHRRAKAFGFVLLPLEPNVGAAVS
jgi:transposase